MPISAQPTKNRVGDLICHVLLAWLLAAAIEYLLLPGELRALSGLEGLAQMSLIRVVCLTGVFTAVLCVLSRFRKTAKMRQWGIAGAFAVLAAAALCAAANWVFAAACVLIGGILTASAALGWDSRPEQKTLPPKAHKACLWGTAGLAAAFFLFVSVWTVGRVASFSASTYDFGIFSQMFYNMKQTGLPMTTLERDGLLSHFAVHVSPIYYLMLPFYCLVPTPATLQVLQAAVLASAVIPLWKIGKHWGLGGVQRMLLCAVLLLYPAYSGGTSYDLHENCFLTPLLLWLFYGIDRKNWVLTGFAAALTLAVKEDAAVYVAVIALWLIVKTLLHFQKTEKPGLIAGVCLLGASLIWFFLVTGYLARSGDGVMTYRYKNFMYDGSSSLFTVIKAVLLSPMKAVYECADKEKLSFFLLTLLPLLGLPLLTRRYERYLLLIPYVLVNLMSDYPYQHSIFFQYTYGATACFLYLTAVNLADWHFDRRRTIALLAAVAISAGAFGYAVVPKAIRYPKQLKEYHSYYESVRRALDTVPEGVPAAATGFYTAYLSNREILYDIRYCSQAHLLDAQYVVLKCGADSEYKRYAPDGKSGGFDAVVALLEENGYTPCYTLDNILIIYQKAG